jgi:hypothetical protein
MTSALTAACDIVPGDYSPDSAPAAEKVQEADACDRRPGQRAASRGAAYRPVP